MNRKEALVALVQGHKVVSYFGFEFELTKHGLKSGDDFVPMPEGNEYTYMGSPGNPHEVGTFAWAEYEFRKDRPVLSPTGERYTTAHGVWEECYFQASDFTESKWTVESE